MTETTFILKDLKRRVRDEATTISQVLDLIDEEIQCAEEWERANKMSPEEIRAYLLANGYTEKSLKEGLDKLHKMVEDEMVKRSGGN